MAKQPTANPVDIAVRHQVYLERYGSQVARDTAKIVKRMGPESVRLMLDLDDEISALSTEELGDVLRELKVLNTRVMATALDELTVALSDLAGYEGDFAARALESVTRNVRISALKAGEVFESALANPIPATGDMLEPFLEGWSQRQVKAVGDVISKGFSHGLTNRQIQDSLIGTKSKRFADGLLAQAEHNAEAIVRTSIQHVASTARHETFARNSDVVEGWEFVATLDSNTTQQCRSLDGKVFPLDKGPKPPVHIRCRSTSVPKISSEFDFLDEGATRSAVGGPVPANMSYYEWLKGQPASFQDDALGATRAKLFRDGGLSADQFARLNLGRNFEPLTLDEMKKREPSVFKRAGL
jgi:SPP1 gp7 family putative phage head morphogenesis protein